MADPTPEPPVYSDLPGHNREGPTKANRTCGHATASNHGRRILTTTSEVINVPHMNQDEDPVVATDLMKVLTSPTKSHLVIRCNGYENEEGGELGDVRVNFEVALLHAPFVATLKTVNDSRKTEGDDDGAGDVVWSIPYPKQFGDLIKTYMMFQHVGEEMITPSVAHELIVLADQWQLIGLRNRAINFVLHNAHKHPELGKGVCKFDFVIDPIKRHILNLPEVKKVLGTSDVDVTNLCSNDLGSSDVDVTNLSSNEWYQYSDKGVRPPCCFGYKFDSGGWGRDRGESAPQPFRTKGSWAFSRRTLSYNHPLDDDTTFAAGGDPDNERNGRADEHHQEDGDTTFAAGGADEHHSDS